MRVKLNFNQSMFLSVCVWYAGWDVSSIIPGSAQTNVRCYRHQHAFTVRYEQTNAVPGPSRQLACAMLVRRLAERLNRNASHRSCRSNCSTCYRRCSGQPSKSTCLTCVLVRRYLQSNIQRKGRNKLTVMADLDFFAKRESNTVGGFPSFPFLLSLLFPSPQSLVISPFPWGFNLLPFHCSLWLL